MFDYIPLARLVSRGLIKDAMNLSLRFEDNNTGHNDLILQFAERIRTCDSYYLALDPVLLAGQEDPKKIRMVLGSLLDQWLEAVEELPDDGVAYLPFDFSDQYTGWLRCERADDVITITSGWAEVEGWSFAPSAIGEYLHHLSGFRSDGTTLRVSSVELIQSIMENKANVSA